MAEPTGLAIMTAGPTVGGARGTLGLENWTMKPGRAVRGGVPSGATSGVLALAWECVGPTGPAMLVAGRTKPAALMARPAGPAAVMAGPAMLTVLMAWSKKQLTLMAGPTGPTGPTALTAGPTVAGARGAACELGDGAVGAVLSGVQSGATSGVRALACEAGGVAGMRLANRTAGVDSWAKRGQPH